MLFDVLEKTGRKTLYCDTDSVIYAGGETSFLETGHGLGKLKNELSCQKAGCPGCDKGEHHITQFVGAGPKNYAYKTDNGATFCKIRGFTLNSRNSAILNYDSLRQLVERVERETAEFITHQKVIRRKKSSATVHTVEETKKYRMVFAKRVLQPDHDSLPFGY